MSSRQQQKEQARAARIAAQERQRADDRRKQRIRVLLGAVLAAAVAVVVAVVVSRSGTSTSAAPTPAQASRLFQGIPEHGNVVGYPQAKVVLQEFGDLKCPVCRSFALNSLPQLVTQYVATGKLRLVFRNLLVIDATSERAARMAIAAGEQSKLWPFVDQFYVQQRDETTDYVNDDFLRMVGRSVPGLDVAKALAARRSPNVSAVLAADQRMTAKYGLTSTPAFLISRVGGAPQPLQISDPADTSQFTQAIDALLAKR